MSTQLEGYYICGVCVGFASTPWKKDPSKFNHQIGIRVSFGSDAFGQPNEETVTVDVSPEDVPVIQSQANEYKDKPVMIPVRVFARSYGDKNFISTMLSKGSRIQPLRDMKAA